MTLGVPALLCLQQHLLGVHTGCGMGPLCYQHQPELAHL